MKLDSEQQKTISRFYSDISKQIQKSSKKLEGKDNVSSVLRKQYLDQMQKEITTAFVESEKKIGNLIEENMLKVSESVVDEMETWNSSLGLPKGSALLNIPKETVEKVTMGKVYSKKWYLSKALWNDVTKKTDDINKVVAEGIALNKSAYDIAKDLEKYVNPKAKKDWNWNKVYPGTNKKIDYNAQRLARTLVSHAYQQSLVDSVKDNPFVSGIRWRSALIHDRTCQLCKDRHNKVFKKNDLPLDHPNGLCTFIAETDDLDDIGTELANWAKGGKNLKIDKFAKKAYGFESPQELKGKMFDNAVKDKNSELMDLTKYETYEDWYYSLDTQEFYSVIGNLGYSKDDFFSDMETAKNAMKDYFKNNKVKTSVAKKLIESDNADDLVDWYNKLDDELVDLIDLEFSEKIDDVSEITETIVKSKWTKKSFEEAQRKAFKDNYALLKEENNFVSSKFQKCYNGLWDEKEIDSLKTYTGGSFSTMNSYLRGISEYISDDLKEVITQCKKAIKTGKIDDDIFVRRGSDYRSLAGLAGGNTHRSRDWLEENYKDIIGKEIVDEGFMSTTPLSGSGFEASGVEYKIFLPKDAEATYIAPISIYESEKEILINAGSRFKVIDVEYRPEGGEKDEGIRKKGYSEEVFIVSLEYIL